MSGTFALYDNYYENKCIHDDCDFKVRSNCKRTADIRMKLHYKVVHKISLVQPKKDEFDTTVINKFKAY